MAGSLAAALVMQLSLPLMSERTGVVADNAALAVIALIATIGHSSQARRSTGQRRWAWTVAAISTGLWSASSVIDTLDEYLGTGTVTDELLATTAAIGALIALGLLGINTGLGRSARWSRVLDTATVAGALFFLAWEFVLGPAYELLPGSAGPMVLAVLIPEFIGAAYAVVMLSRSLSNRGDVALSLLASGLLAFATTMLLAIYNNARDLPWHATGVGAGYVLAGLLMLLASRAPLPAFDQQTRPDGRWSLLPYLPVGLAFAAAASRFLHTGQVTAVLFWLLLGTATLVLARQFVNLRLNQQLAAELAYQAGHDPLTGLANRSGFQREAEAALAAAGPDGLTGVLLIDLDGFKTVNDTYGHTAGDALLTGVAERVRAAVRPGDTVARFGGDEFVVVLPGLRDAEAVAQTGNQILDRLAEPIDVGGVRITASGSVGGTTATGSDHRPLELVEEADRALYEAKAAGKGVVRCFGDRRPSGTGSVR